MEVIVYIIAAVYILLAVLVLTGLIRRQNEPEGPGLTAGSVIICARDEEKDLPACLNSLENQSLDGVAPQGLEIVLVDDASVDRTAQIMEEFAQGSRFPVRVVHMPPPLPGEQSGKWRPLKEGIKLASHEGLLLTDADAVLPPEWVKNHLRYLGSYQMTAGFARIQGEGLWGKIQALDWIFLLGVGSAMNRWGIPLAALGKNLSLRRSSYDSVGGLEGVGFTLTEDLSLVQAVVRNKGKLKFPLAPRMMVGAPAVGSWGEFVSQRKRWASGVKRLKPMGKFCIVAMALRHLAIVVGILAGMPQALGIWVATAIMNLAIQCRLSSKLGLLRLILFFPLWEIFYTWTAPLLAISFIVRRRIVWKDRRFNRSAAPVEAA
jgi:cellulose synthase/poly-beta-1,6-N-acetylglucosamine synthase-like glycosyltransferase